MWDFPLFPEQASTTAGAVDAVYLFILAITVFFTALICFLILFFSVKYRRGSPADRTNPPTHNGRLEAFWITVPLCIALVIFFWSAFVFFDVYNPPRDAFEIYVIGKQWMWKLQHPEGKGEINELHVPLGRPVLLKMT